MGADMDNIVDKCWIVAWIIFVNGRSKIEEGDQTDEQVQHEH